MFVELGAANGRVRGAEQNGDATAANCDIRRRHEHAPTSGAPHAYCAQNVPPGNGVLGDSVVSRGGALGWGDFRRGGRGAQARGERLNNLGQRRGFWYLELERRRSRRRCDKPTPGDPLALQRRHQRNGPRCFGNYLLRGLGLGLAATAAPGFLGGGGRRANARFRGPREPGRDVQPRAPGRQQRRRRWPDPLPARPGKPLRRGVAATVRPAALGGRAAAGAAFAGETLLGFFTLGRAPRRERQPRGERSIEECEPEGPPACRPACAERSHDPAA